MIIRDDYLLINLATNAIMSGDFVTLRRDISPRLHLTPRAACWNDGLTEEEGRPRGELARWRDEPQLLAILGTDRRTALTAPQPAILF